MSRCDFCKHIMDETEINKMKNGWNDDLKHIVYTVDLFENFLYEKETTCKRTIGRSRISEFIINYCPVCGREVKQHDLPDRLQTDRSKMEIQ